MQQRKATHKVNAEACRLLFNVFHAELGEVIQEYLFVNFAQKARKLRVVEEDPGPELGNLSRLNLALLEVGVPFENIKKSLY